MTLRLIAIFTLAGFGLQPATADTRTPRFAIYYSFDEALTPALFSEMQAEFARIVDPVGLPVEWHEIGGGGGGEFTEIFTVRFHGSCSAERGGKSEAPLTPDERSLAATSVSDGRVLPFAQVRCDQLRRYLAPGMRGRADAASVLARAMARVAAHEIYHMLTGSVVHGGPGISRAEYSFEFLTCARFAFLGNEIEWLRAKPATSTPHRSL